MSNKSENVLIQTDIPFSLDAEKGTLGSFLIEPDLIMDFCSRVKAEFFYRKAHRIIYKNLIKLVSDEKQVDLLILSDYLRDNKELDEVGGSPYLSSLVNFVPTSCNAKHYIEIIEEKYKKRETIKIGKKIINNSLVSNKDSKDVLSQAEDSIFKLSSGNFSGDFSSVGDILFKTFDNIEKLTKTKEQLTGITSGFRDLDRMTSGFQKSDLIIIAARPSMGKTALALNIAANVKTKKPIPIFSLEMSEDQLVQRLLSSESQVDSHRLRTGMLTTKDWDKLSLAAQKLGDKNIFIDDTMGITPLEIRTKCRKLASKEGELGLILIDYLQLMNANLSNPSRQQEVSDISRSLKQLAREMNCPVISLSQLSRAVEQRNDKRPQLSDLRSSGSIEQDADVVAFIYRDDYYNIDSQRKGITEVIIGKQRNGPVGTIELGFQKEYTKFVDLSQMKR